VKQFLKRCEGRRPCEKQIRRDDKKSGEGALDEKIEASSASAQRNDTYWAIRTARMCADRMICVWIVPVGTFEFRQTGDLRCRRAEYNDAVRERWFALRSSSMVERLDFESFQAARDAKACGEIASTRLERLITAQSLRSKPETVVLLRKADMAAAKDSSRCGNCKLRGFAMGVPTLF